MLKVEKDRSGNIYKVLYIIDPFGFCYGYSTVGAKAKDDSKSGLPNGDNHGTRSDLPVGFNPTYDMWSTSGRVSTATPTDADRSAWVKNW